jgi:hypothetical protein
MTMNPMSLVFDIEGDGLYEDITQIWCICTKEVESGKEAYFYETPVGGVICSGDINAGVEYLLTADTLIGHNIIDYDFRVLEKFFGAIFKGKVVDTLILSQLLRPDRFGGHSLDSWGQRVGRKKPEHEDWSRFTPEMLHRCREDVLINTLTYRHLLEEAKTPIEGVKLW